MTNYVRQLLDALGYSSGDHDADVRAALQELLTCREPLEWKFRYIHEGKLEVDVEDGGAALIGHLNTGDSTVRDGDIFVRIHSYDERVRQLSGGDSGMFRDRKRLETARVANPDIHRDFVALEGQRLRVKIEALR